MLHLRCRADSRSSEILTYDRNPPGMLRTSRNLPVRSGFLLPAALHLELFEQPAGFTEFFSTLLKGTPGMKAAAELGAIGARAARRG
jgi:hypothetical protein